MLARAMNTLGRAETLDGCTNRVLHLRCCAQLERARLLVAAGDHAGARADIDAVLAMRDSAEARDPHARSWHDLLREAELTDAELQRAQGRTAGS